MILYSVLYFFVFIMLLASFSIEKTASKTYEMNLSDRNIEMLYNSGMENVSVEKFVGLKKSILKIDKNVLNIYSKNRFFDLYDFDFLNIDIIDGTSSNKRDIDNGVYLSLDYKDEYNTGETYTFDNVSFEILGFFEGENSVIADIEYILSLKKYDIRNISFTVKYEELKKKNIDELMGVYDTINNSIDENEYFSCTELETIKNVDKISNIYVILSTIFLVVFFIFSVITIINVSDINVKIDGSYYAMMRINGLEKKKVVFLVFIKDTLLNLGSIILAIILFYCSINLFKDYISKLISTIFELFIDDFSFNIINVYYVNVLVFLIPFVFNIAIIYIRTILVSKFKKSYDYLGGLDDYAR